MIRSAITTFYRSLIRHPLYAALNLLGLSFGVAVFIVLVLFVRFETSYEQWLPHASAIYEVSTAKMVDGKIRKQRFASAGGTFDAVHREFPDVLGTRVAAAYMVVRKGDQVYEEQGQLVDKDAFRLFRVRWLAGNAETALRPGGVVLSEAMARKYFGRTDIVGRAISLRDDVGPSIGAPGEPAPTARNFTVTGVIGNPPANSVLHFDFVRLLTEGHKATEPWWNDWTVTRHHTYLYLPTPGEVKRVSRHLDRVVDTYGTAVQHDGTVPNRRHDLIRLILTPLAAEHLSDAKTRATVWLLGVVGILALGVALINYINLATARAGLRAREVAVRKAMGATIGQVRLQFLTEALLVSLVAALLGFSLVELLLPPINAFGGLALRLDYVRETPLLLSLLAAVALSGLLAGMYPAVVLSGFEPAHVLSSSRSPAGGRLGLLVREGLAVVQFTVVTVFFIVVIGFGAQTRHVETSDLGFERHGVLITNSTISAFLDRDKVETIRAQWRALPNVVSVSTGAVPGPYFLYGVTQLWRPEAPARKVETKAIYIERDFFPTYGTKRVAGRSLSDGDRIESMDGPAAGGPAWINVDINRSAAAAFGFANPSQAVGHALVSPVVSLRVVGVVEDQRFAAPTEDIGPAVYIIGLNTASDSSTLVRFEGVPEEVARARMAAVWRSLAPDLPLTVESVAEVLDGYYVGDRQNTGLFAVGAMVAGFVGGIGLYGMAAFSTSNRSREIGLRKAMGASRRRIAALLVMQFLRPVLIANLVAWPVAWLFLSRWLGQFDDRVPTSLWFFSLGSAASLFIAVVTVAGLALAAAWASPGKALRHG